MILARRRGVVRIAGQVTGIGGRLGAGQRHDGRGADRDEGLPATNAN